MSARKNNWCWEVDPHIHHPKKVMETEKEKTTLETLTSETPKTRFCQKCDQEITKGKEIKIEKWLKHLVDFDYRRGESKRTVRYETPIERAIYYVCPDCFRQIERELARVKRKKEIWEWILLGMCAVGVIVLISLFVVYGNSRK